MTLFSKEQPRFKFYCKLPLAIHFVGSRTKIYGLVFDKHVIDLDTFKSYPYIYTPSGFNDVDMENAETLLEL